MSNRPDEQNQTSANALPQEDPAFFTAEEPALLTDAPEQEAQPVSLVDKVSQFEQTRIIEQPELVSLSDFGDTPLPESTPEPPVQAAPAVRRKPRTKREKQEQRAWRWVKGLSYTVVVIGISLLCTYLIIGGILDVTGLQKSETVRRVDIEEGATTSDVAKALEESGLIDQKLIFRLYSKMTHADGTYQPGTFYLTANMGYSELIRNLQEVQVRETVTVTIPEGSTVEHVARLLSTSGVCEYNDFYAALVNADTDTFAYDFLNDVPKRTDAGYEERIYWLEGYLFPDTYEFYVGISAEDAIDKLLGNFDAKLDDELKALIAKSGYTLDEVITLASIVQGEAADIANMPKVSRVILNRMDNYAEFPYLQCDSTGDYLDKLAANQVDIGAEDSAYDSYTHMGLPPGPINNPSLAAIQAVVKPSTDERIMKCYYFANDAARNTYYSITYDEHVATCQKYNIGIHAN